MLNLIKGFFKGHKRTAKARKNIVASLLIKGMSVIVGFLMIRITLGYLNETKYGIWLTLTSFLTWFSFFEIGLGGGLKNRLAISFAEDDYEKGKIYVSTTYAILTIITSAVALIFLIVNPFLDWSKILNSDISLAPELTIVALIVFNFFFLRFVFKLITIVLTADQRPAVGNSFGPIGNLVSLILVYILTKTTEASLIYLSLIMSVIPVLVLILVSLYLFNGRYSKISPSYKYVRFEHAKDLFNLGFKFFFIQISMLIMFQSSNIIIAQFYGPDEVTEYNIAYKLFSVILMLFTIIASPFQVAFTEAWVKKDMVWIKKTIRNLFYVWVGFVGIGVLLFVISDPFFDFWLGEEQMKNINISTSLKISLLVYFLVFTFGGVFNMFINGLAKVLVQMYANIIGAIIFIPLAYILIKYFELGIESVVIAAILANFYHPFIAPYQYYKLINNKAKGIWDK